MHTVPHTDAAKQKMRAAKLGKHISPATEFKPDETNPYEPQRIASLARGEKHYKWLEVPTYTAVHSWIAKILGKPMVCENCSEEKDNPRAMHWANLSGKYLRDISDWARLCARCHYLIDDIYRRRWETRHSNG